jgi:hypothetical protein
MSATADHDSGRRFPLVDHHPRQLGDRLQTNRVVRPGESGMQLLRIRQAGGLDKAALTELASQKGDTSEANKSLNVKLNDKAAITPETSNGTLRLTRHVRGLFRINAS